MRTKIHIAHVGISILAATGVLHGSAAYAQDRSVLEEVIVTAQKRAQSAQDVSASLVVLDSQQVNDVQDLNDIINMVPNVSLTGFSQNQNVITIRAIGSGDDGAAGDAATAVHYDGIFLSRDGSRDIMPFDLTRVEILRGPQGTLYGKNAVGGAVNYVPNRPTDEFESVLQATAGNSSLMEFRGMVNGALSENIDGRIAFNATDRDGYSTNVVTGNDIGGVKNRSVRGGLTFAASDTLEIYVGADYSTDDSNGHARKLDPNFGTQFLPIPFVPGIANTISDVYQIEVNTDGNFDRETGGITVEMNKDFDAGVVTWLSGYRDLRYSTSYDLDGSLQNWLVQNINEESDQFSTELRFASNPADSGQLEYVAGVYFLTVDVNRHEFNDYYTGLVNPFAPGMPPIDTRASWRQTNTTDASAVFAELKYRLNDNLALIAGGRYSNEEKDFTMLTTCGNQSGTLFTRGPDIPVAPFQTGGPGLAGTCLANVYAPIFGQSQYQAEANSSWSRFTGKLGAEYSPNDDYLLYFTFSQGFKSGGFPPSGTTEAVGETAFNEELADSFEIGGRTTLLNGGAFLNFALFSTDYNDLQVGVLDPVSGALTIQNAADATSQGLEVDFALSVSDQLSLFASYAYVDATYDRFLSSGNDFSGEPLRGPKNSASLRGIYDVPIGNGGLLTLQAELNYKDEIWQFPVDPRSLMPARTLVNASASFRSSDESWKLTVWARNLTDEKEVLQSVPPPGGLSSLLYGPPKTYGISVAWSY